MKLNWSYITTIVCVNASMLWYFKCFGICLCYCANLFSSQSCTLYGDPCERLNGHQQFIHSIMCISYSEWWGTKVCCCYFINCWGLLSMHTITICLCHHGNISNNSKHNQGWGIYTWPYRSWSFQTTITQTHKIFLFVFHFSSYRLQPHCVLSQYLD